MKSNEFVVVNLNNLEVNEEIFIGENDDEVLNCEGSPCNFVYNPVDK